MELTPTGRPRSRLIAWIGATLVCWAAAVGGGAGLAAFLLRDLPGVLSLEDYTPPALTRVYAGDGSILKQFGQQRRIIVPRSGIPDSFRQAIISVEDAGFYRHPGVDPKGILRAAYQDVLRGRLEQGASTITQQLAQDLFLTKDKTWTRKIQEAILALQVEKSYTKDEILELYCNQIYFGHGFYGIESASRFYFGKPASAMALEQAALLAGIVRRPEAYSPFKHPDRAKGRRAIVLRRMVAEQVLTPVQAEAASARSLGVVNRTANDRQIGLYFLEEVRKDLASRYGDNSLYKEGFEVHTTLDRSIQAVSERALRKHLRRVDRRRGFRPVQQNILQNDGIEPEQWEGLDTAGPLNAGEVRTGVVLSVDPDRATVRLGPGDVTGELASSDAEWTNEDDLTRVLRRGDVTLFEIMSTGDEGAAPRLVLDQEPEVEGAVVVLDPRTGRVLALVGGYAFERSEYNRAIQARRPVGSSFKPILYAAALENGFAPTDRIYDEPTIFVDTRTGSLYEPENYERDYWGLITLRTALEHSRNIAAVKLINLLGFEPVFDTASRLGITERLNPYPSLALGAVEISLLEMVSAYGAFANGGLRLEAHLIDRIIDREGRTRHSADPQSTEALDSSVAYVLTQMMQGVVRRGSAKSLSDFPRPVAGKTGTTDGHSDAWFIGFTTNLVCGVWVGLDKVESIGRGQSGARVALPIWNEIMLAATANDPDSEFTRPSRVTQAPVDLHTGLRATVETGCSNILLESFIEGTEPQALCGRVPHFRDSLPYFIQEEALGDDLRLHLTTSDLDQILTREREWVTYLPLSSSLTITYGETAMTVGLRLPSVFDNPFNGWGSTAPDGAEGPRGRLLRDTPFLDIEALPPLEEDDEPLEERRGLDGRVPSVYAVRPDR